MKNRYKELWFIDLMFIKLKIYLFDFYGLIILLERFIIKYFVCKGEIVFKVNIKRDKFILYID